MKIHTKKIGLLPLLILTGLLVFSSCNDDKWDEHYNADPSIVSGQTVWQTIKETPQLSKFAWAVRKTGYDKMLSSSQMLTVWAPDNDATDNIDTTITSIKNEILLKEYVQNHISKYSYPASGTVNSRIKLLNGKQVIFTSNNGEYSIDDIQLKEKNKVASNGLIHVIGKRIPFFNNIWEYLSKISDVDSIKSYLYSYDKLIFDEAKSIPGDVVDGKTVYLDSVIYNSNAMFSYLGAMNDEDSTYTMLLPTNAAWKTAYSKIKNYYNYYSSSADTKITADTLQRRYTLLSLIQDLLYSHTIQKMDQIFNIH
ncbi:MAG: fasciclin domain-containing protein [Paludibacteraceae bacterium]